MSKESVVAFHLHTNLSDGVEHSGIYPVLAKRRNVGGLAFGDHDNNKAAFLAAEQAERLGIKDIFYVHGAEVTTAEGHLLVISKEPFPNFPLYQSLEKVIGGAWEIGCLAVAPHVGFGPPPFSISPAVFWRLEKHNLLPDGIEAYCPHYNLERTEMALCLGADFGLAFLGGEDDHYGDFGRILTRFPGETIDDFFEAVRARKTGVLIRNLPPQDIPPEKRAGRFLLSLFKGLNKKRMSSRDLLETWAQLWQEEKIERGGRIN